MRSWPAAFVLCVWMGWTPDGNAQEVQQHGVIFEEWIRQTFFGGYQPEGYTQKWDIPAEANRDHGGIPVNPKAIKYGAPVGMGDALRQFDSDENHLLILGFWDQTNGDKRFVKAAVIEMTPELHRKLWAPIDRASLEALDAVIKNRELPVTEVRKMAQEMKNRPPFSEAIMQVNPKIDTKGQRRLQCSIRFADVFKHLAPEVSPQREERPTLFGVEIPKVRDSGPRTFGE